MTFKSFSQLNPIDTTFGGATFSSEKFLKHSAGYELHLASKHYFMGLGIASSGILIGTLGITSAPSSNGNVKGFEIFAGLAALTGCVFITESHLHLNRAGIILDRNGIGLALKLNKK